MISDVYKNLKKKNDNEKVWYGVDFFDVAMF